MRPNPLMPTRMPISPPSVDARSRPSLTPLCSKLLERPEAAVHCSLRRRGTRSSGKLAQRCGGVAEPELGSLAESVREPVEILPGAKSHDRFQLAPCRAACAHEVRVVRVREAVRPRARLRHDRTLL